jgi:hypothetical protein
MSVEQKVRDNLTAAADALVVPEPRRQATTKTAPGWRRRLTVAAAGAAAVIALVAIPVILTNLGDTGQGPATPIDTTLASTTTTVPETSTSPAPYGFTLLETSTASTRFYVSADQVGSDDPQAATVELLALPVDGDQPIDDVIIGDEGGFFWNTVTDVDGVCSLFSSTNSSVDRVVLQVRLSSSIGCSSPYVYELRDGSLAAVDPVANEIAQLFIDAWKAGDQTTMAGLASSEATQDANGIEAPVDPVFSMCEGTAGSSYCTWTDSGRNLTIRVQEVDQPPVVIEVLTEPAG